jgi:hypothetical protein
MGKMSLSLFGSYLGYQAQNFLFGENKRPERVAHFQQKAARRVRQELGAMKGPAMKLGQLLSMHTGMLPEEARRELVELQMQAPGMHSTLARAQFKSSLGKDPEELFREFEPEPFAAASLGQVHRAVTRKGERVAVKIQYPAIRSAIENDFMLLRSATFPGRLSGFIPNALLDEIQRGILEETDYRQEADNLDLFHKGLAGLGFVTIPRVYREFSTERVLTMSFVEGEKMDDFLKRKPSQELRDLVAARVAEAHETQIIRLKAVHADQHPGNYLFRTDGSIGLVDFGCVKRISFDVVALRQCFRERSWRKSEAAERRYLRTVFDPRAPLAHARKMLPLIERLADLDFPEDSTADLILDYRDHKSREKLLKLGSEYWKRMIRYKLINPEFAFLSRASFGLHHLLQSLGARINISEVMRRVPDAAE